MQGGSPVANAQGAFGEQPSGMDAAAPSTDSPEAIELSVSGSQHIQTAQADPGHSGGDGDAHYIVHSESASASGITHEDAATAPAAGPAAEAAPGSAAADALQAELQALRGQNEKLQQQVRKRTGRM